MKLLRIGEPGSERPALIDGEGVLRDLSGHVADIGGAALLPEGLGKLRGIDASSLPRVNGTPRIGSCVAGIGKIICVGLNYSMPPNPTCRSPRSRSCFSNRPAPLSGPTMTWKFP
jgi:hypothetical protein